MYFQIYAKYCISSLVGIVFSGICVAGEMEMHINEAALEFAQKWLASPKMYVGLILPNGYPFSINDVVKLTKKINSDVEGRNAYLMVNSNVTIFNKIPHTQNELIWYPFDIENYDINCLFLDSSRYERLYKKHFLFSYEKTQQASFSFDTCKVRFDSRLAIYHMNHTSKSIVQFDEVYKITENGNTLMRNTLGEIILGQKEMLVSGLNTYIWNRRKSLDGRIFNAVSINTYIYRLLSLKSRRTQEVTPSYTIQDTFQLLCHISGKQ